MSDDRDTRARHHARAPDLPRRDALRALLGAGLAAGLEGCARPGEVDAVAPGPGSADASDVSKHTHPAAGDRLVFAFGEREGDVITPADVRPGGPQVFAYPMDADASHVAAESRLSQVMLVRLDPAGLSEQTAANAVDGIVAYSAVCTHTGCEIIDWAGVARRFQCPCHDSEFDPSDNGRVVGGPAPRRLAALPLMLVDGELRAAGGFTGRVGAQRR